MLKLETIKYKNFLSVGDIFVEIDLCCSQNTLVVGKNGNGKCLHPATKIDIRIKSKETEKKFEDFMKNR